MIRVLPLLVVVTLAACSKSTPTASAAETGAAVPAGAQPALLAGQSAPAPEAPQPPATPVKPVPEELPETVARVNGETVSRAELEEAIAELVARVGRPIPLDQRDEIVRGVLEQVIGYRLLVQESAARSVAVSDADIDARIAEIRQQFESEEAFEQVLKERGMTRAGLRDEIRNGLRIDKLIEAEVAGKAAVTPQQVTEFYQQNAAEFQQGERVRASHILIRFPENADTAARDKARAQAASVLAEVKAGGDFAALARQHSQDPGSAVNGGDVGYFERGQMVPPFEQAAFSMQPAQTSELVETMFGYHIIRVADKQPARTVPLEEARPQIQQFLEGQAREQHVDAFVASLRAKGRVEILI